MIYYVKVTIGVIFKAVYISAFAYSWDQTICSLWCNVRSHDHYLFGSHVVDIEMKLHPSFGLCSQNGCWDSEYTKHYWTWPESLLLCRQLPTSKERVVIRCFSMTGCSSLFLLPDLLRFGLGLATASHKESDWLSWESVLYTSVSRLLLELMGQSRLCAWPRAPQTHITTDDVIFIALEVYSLSSDELSTNDYQRWRCIIFVGASFNLLLL